MARQWKLRTSKSWFGKMKNHKMSESFTLLACCVSCCMCCQCRLVMLSNVCQPSAPEPPERRSLVQFRPSLVHFGIWDSHLYISTNKWPRSKLVHFNYLGLFGSILVIGSSMSDGASADTQGPIIMSDGKVENVRWEIIDQLLARRVFFLGGAPNG